MKNETKLLRGYSSPSVDVIEMSSEGILCQSGSIDGSGSGGDHTIDPIDFF